ncbi:MAG: hypothetical protein HY903_01375 [Deltaproteobacteria bacterium]|nr:hypothetical protein [Deltaproteobacteria bacterium]
MNLVAETAADFDNLIGCRMAGTADPFTTCLGTSALAGFARLTDAGGVDLSFPQRQFPLTLYVKPNNNMPVVGGVDLGIDLLATGSFASFTTIAVEQPLATFTAAVTPTGLSLAATQGTATLSVTAALNGVGTPGGNEPPTARWQAVRAEWVVGAVRQDASADVTPQSWLPLTAATEGSTPITVTVPPASAIVFPPGATELRVGFQGFHQVSPPSPVTVPEQTTPVVELIIVPEGVVPPVDQCELSVGARTLGFGARTTLKVQRLHGTDPPVPITAGVQFTSSLAGFQPEPTAEGATFLAPSLAAAAALPELLDGKLPVVMSATVPAGVCPDAIPSQTITITSIGSLELKLDKDQVTPGGLVRLTGKVTGNADAAGLRFVVSVPPALKAVRAMPTGSGALVPAPVAEPVDATLIARHVKQTGKLQTLQFAADVQSGSVGEFNLPLVARAIAAGGTAEVEVGVYYAVGEQQDEIVAAERKKLVIAADPELTEATLVGKVFDDQNGDGEQQEGELGIPKVMVALAAGVYAITDDDGLYHIVRLQPGRHVVKINRDTLPQGAVLTTPVHREVTLTPGGFVRVSFGAKLPDLAAGAPLAFVGEHSGFSVVDGKPIYGARFVVAPDRRLAAKRSGVVITAQAQGTEWLLPLPPDVEEPFWTLVETAEDGRTWLSAFALYVYPQKGGGALVVPWGPSPIARVALPPSEKPVASERLVMVGDVLGPAALEIGGAASGKGATGCSVASEPTASATAPQALRCELPTRVKLSAVTVTTDPAPDLQGVDPPRASLELPVVVEPTASFFVGMAGVEASAVLGHEKGADPWQWGPGGAFFYRGVQGGDWRVTAGADLSQRGLFVTEADGQARLRDWGGFAAELLRHNPRRIFRDLDPEAYYPTYGDQSMTVDERESGGRFFFRVEKDQSFVRWGAVNTAIDDAEVGRYVRSLYGMGGRLSLGEAQDAVKLRAVAFAARPDSAAAKDELTVTGGTLYFLSHRDLVEGSLRVTLEMLDEISGLPVRATPLVEGPDYTADHLGGRIVLDSGLSYRAFGASLTADGSGGSRARLLVEYEYVPAATNYHDYTFGGRAVGTLGPVALGVTGVSELVDPKGGAQGSAGDSRSRFVSRYALVAASARLDLGSALQARLELGHSRGGNVSMGKSIDGGLSFASGMSGLDGAGNAAAIELKTGVGGAQAMVYGRFSQPGFTDSRTPPGMLLAQGGLRVDAPFTSGTRLWGQVDYRETTLSDASPAAHTGVATTIGTKTKRELAVLGASQRVARFKLDAEGRYEKNPGVQSERLLAGLQLGYQVLPELAVFARRRQLVRADTVTWAATPRGESAVGAELQDLATVDLLLEAGLADDGRAFGRAQGSVPVAEDTELYAGYRVASRLHAADPTAAPAAKDGVVVGGRRLLPSGALLYSEQNLRVDGGERTLTRTVGAQTPVGAHSAVSLSYERGALDREDDAAGRARDALSVGGTYVADTFTLRLLGDGRLDRLTTTRSAELGCQGRLELRPVRGLTVALAGRGGSGYEGGEGLKLTSSRRAWEGAVGLAYRSITVAWLDVFARYAVEHERSRAPALDQQWAAIVSHVVSTAVVADLAPPLSVGPKVAYRVTRGEAVGVQFSDHALLVALRSDLHAWDSWDVAVEGRGCAVPYADVSTTYGALAELSLLALDWLRLGAGYNFSSIAAAGVSCREPGARGLFVRAEAVY